MKKALVFIFALLCALTSYAQQFRLVGNLTGFATVVDDSTYNVSLSFPSDLTGNSFLPTQIADDGSYRIFFQTGRIYTVTGVANATFSDADLTLVEYGSTDGSPTGQAIVFDPQGRESVPQAPIAASGASGVLNAAIVSYNLPFQQGFGDGDGNDLVLSPGVDLESTTYTDAQALFTAIVASLNTKVDTLYERSDSLFYQVGGVETLFAVDTGGGGSLVDGDYGDVTVSGSGTVITINGQAVTFAKFQDIPENTFVGRDEAGAGSAETLTPAEARTLLNVEDGATADQTATDVPITDAGAYYTGTDVEAALQEVADTLTDLRTDLSAIAAGAADGVATAGAYDGLNEEIDVTVAAPGANFSIDVSSLASDSELSDSTAQVRSEIPTTASDLPIVDAGGYYTTSDVEAALQEEAVNRIAVDNIAGDLVTLSGQPVSSTDMGTFTGTTISDGNTTKGALQELETAVESKTASDIPIADAGAIYTATDVEGALQEVKTDSDLNGQLVGDLITLSGVPITSQDLGTFTGTTITDANTVKGALQELETAVESAGGGGLSPTDTLFNVVYEGTVTPVNPGDSITFNITAPVAEDVVYTPAGNITSTNVQSMGEELDEAIQQLTISQNAGVVGFDTKAIMDTTLNTYPANTLARIANDPTPANNGYYAFNGTSWASQNNLYAEVLDEDDTANAVTGSAVGKWVRNEVIGTIDDNYLFDPYFRTIDPGENYTGRDGNSYAGWTGETNMAFVEDSNNPYIDIIPGARTVTFPTSGSTIGGKVITLAADSLLDVGDVISFGIIAKVDSGALYRPFIQFRDIGDSNISSHQGNNVTGTPGGGTDTLLVENITIPASTVTIRLIWQEAGDGSPNINVYSMFLKKSAEAGDSPRYPITEANTDSIAALKARIETLEGLSFDSLNYWFPEEQIYFGEQYLSGWNIAAARNYYNSLTAFPDNYRVKVGAIGDSHVAQDLAFNIFDAVLQDKYGNGNIAHGYVCAGAGIGNDLRAKRDGESIVNLSSTWSRSDSNIPGLGGLCNSEITGTFANSDTIRIEINCEAFRIFHQTYSGGGEFEYRINDTGAWTTIDTDGVADTVGVVETTPIAFAMNTLSIRLVSGSVTFFGFEGFNDDGGGAVFHKMGNGGSEQVDWDDIDTTYMRAQLDALDLDLLFVLLGTNDAASFRTKQDFKDAAEITINYFQALSPTTSIIYMPAWDNQEGDSEEALLAEYADAIRELAVKDLDFAVLNLHKAFGGGSINAFESLEVAYDISDDNNHPNYNGGAFIVKLILDFID